MTVEVKMVKTTLVTEVVMVMRRCCQDRGGGDHDLDWMVTSTGMMVVMMVVIT